MDKIKNDLSSPNKFKRESAIRALGRKKDPDSVSLLIQCFNDKIWTVRDKASKALKQIGTLAVEQLKNCINSNNDEIKYWGIKTLGEIGGNATDILLNELNNDDITTKLYIIEALKKTKNIKVINSVITLFDSSYLSVCQKAANILVSFGSDAIEPIKKIIDMTKQNRVYWGIRVLAMIGDEALSHLDPFFEDKNKEMRYNTLFALEGVKNSSIISKIIKRFDDEVWIVRDRACKTLASVGKIALKVMFREYCSSDNENIVFWSKKTLSEMEYPGIKYLIDEIEFTTKMDKTKVSNLLTEIESLNESQLEVLVSQMDLTVDKAIEFCQTGITSTESISMPSQSFAQPISNVVMESSQAPQPMTTSMTTTANIDMSQYNQVLENMQKTQEQLISTIQGLSTNQEKLASKLDNLKDIKIEMPEIKFPEFKMPEIKMDIPVAPQQHLPPPGVSKFGSGDSDSPQKIIITQEEEEFVTPKHFVVRDRYPYTLNQILKWVKENGCSDMHLNVGLPPMVRIHGSLVRTAFPVLTASNVLPLIFSILTREEREKFIKTWECDTCYDLPGVARFRVNVFYQNRGVNAVLRTIPSKVLTFADLALDEKVFGSIAMEKQGLILVTGPTGSGKSTTLAAMLDYINTNKAEHILTVEDPVEFVHQHKKSAISQRELHKHTKSFGNSLKAALREDPDIILVGEMRDFETISLAVTAAETGHLVFGTLHTSSAPQTIGRIIDVFPESAKAQIQTQLGQGLCAVISQRLFKTQNGKGRAAAHEIMRRTPAISNLIKENKIEHIYSQLQMGKEYGMKTMDMSLGKLVEEDKIWYAEAVSMTYDKKTFVQKYGHLEKKQEKRRNDILEQQEAAAESAVSELGPIPQQDPNGGVGPETPCYVAPIPGASSDDDDELDIAISKPSAPVQTAPAPQPQQVQAPVAVQQTEVAQSNEIQSIDMGNDMEIQSMPEDNSYDLNSIDEVEDVGGTEFTLDSLDDMDDGSMDLDFGDSTPAATPAPAQAPAPQKKKEEKKSDDSDFDLGDLDISDLDDDLELM